MRARLELRVFYDAPASNCRRRVRVLPHSTVPLEREQLLISPLPTHQSEQLDRFGNRVLQVRHARIERELAMSLEVEATRITSIEPLEAGTLGAWKLPSRAAAFSQEMVDFARPLRTMPARKRAEHLNQFVFESLEYVPQTSDSPENAARTWTAKRGSCADFAHVLLSLSRAAGLPARYVAGFGPAHGALHAWVELGYEGAWHAFDPTHGRRAQGLYLPVAKGRDFYDCAPHQGIFHGRNARFQLHCELSPRLEREA